MLQTDRITIVHPYIVALLVSCLCVAFITDFGAGITLPLILLRSYQCFVLSASLWMLLSIFNAPAEGPSYPITRLILSISLLLLFWTPLGYDVTDAGTRAAKSFFLFDSYWPRFVGMKTGSSLVNAFWLHLFPAPSLIWARLGYIAVETGMCVLTYKSLRLRFDSKAALLAAFMACFVSTTYVYKAIHYTNFPVMMTMVGIYFLLASDSKKPLPIFLSGAAMAFAGFAKFPLIALLPLALLYFFIVGLRNGKLKSAIRPMLHFIVGYAALWIAVGTWLFSMDALNTYLGHLQSNFVDPFFLDKDASRLKRHYHDPSSLKSIYWDNLLRTGLHTIVALAFTLPVAIGIYLKRSWIVWISCAIAATGAILLTKDSYWAYSIIAALLCLHGLQLAFSLRHPNFSWMYWGGALMLVSFLGSNVGIRNIIISGGASLYMGSLFASLFERSQTDTALSTWRPLALALTLSTCFIVFHLKNHFIYRDRPISELTAPLRGSAFGIFTHPQRADVVNPLLDALSRLDKSEKLMCVNLHSMHNYLSGLGPGSQFYWKLAGQTEHEKNAYFHSTEAPRYLLLATVNTRDWAWPDTEKHCIDDDLPYYEYYATMLQDPSGPYRVLYANKAFELYEKKE
ncbi:MAG: glycosyltransferase family 39 protein [Cryomorphaceae bacterium]